MMYVTKGLITAPPEFWNLTEDELDEISNGAGPKGFGWLVPDTMWGLKITPAADVHDFMYQRDYPKKNADDLFYDNLQSIIIDKGGILKYPRLNRAKLYYLAVKYFGNGFKGSS